MYGRRATRAFRRKMAVSADGAPPGGGRRQKVTQKPPPVWWGSVLVARIRTGLVVPQVSTGAVAVLMHGTLFAIERCGGFAWFDVVPDTAVKQERGDDCLKRAVSGKHLARDHGGGFAPLQRVALVGVVLAKIGGVRGCEQAAHPLTGTFK